MGKELQVSEVEALSRKLRSLDKESLIKVLGTAIQEQQSQIVKLKTKADFYDRITSTKKLIPMDQCAKILNVNGIGRNNLFQFLRDINVLGSDGASYNQPYQRYVDVGYFSVKEKEVNIYDNYTKVYVQTYITQKGLDFVRRKLEEHGFRSNEDDNE